MVLRSPPLSDQECLHSDAVQRERSLSQGCLSDLRLERSHHDDCWQISSPIQLLENRRELNMAHLCFLNTRRDLLPWGLPTIPGIVIGLLPSLRYSMLHHLNPITTLFSLFHGLDAHPPTTWLGILHDVKETILVSIPTATGNPFCPVQELTFLSDNTPRTPGCEAIRGVWGVGYLVLLALALLLTIIMLWRLRSRFRTETELSSTEKQALLVRSTTRLMMLGAGVLP